MLQSYPSYSVPDPRSGDEEHEARSCKTSLKQTTMICHICKGQEVQHGNSQAGWLIKTVPLQAEVQSLYHDGSVALQTRTSKYGKVLLLGT